MTQAMQRFSISIRHRERMLSMRLSKVDLSRLIHDKKDVLKRQYQSLVSSIRERMQIDRTRLGVASGKIDALSPLGILQRGFSLCRDSQGLIVKNAARVSPGDEVETGQPLLELEAMKMENEIRAPRAGRIKMVNVTAGQGVKLNELLVVID